MNEIESEAARDGQSGPGPRTKFVFDRDQKRLVPLMSRGGGTFQNQMRLKSFKLARSIVYGPSSREALSNITHFRRGSGVSSLLIPSPILTAY